MGFTILMTILSFIAGVGLGVGIMSFFIRPEAEAAVEEPKQAPVIVYDIKVPESADSDIHFPNSEGHF